MPKGVMVMDKNKRDFHYDPDYTYKNKDIVIQKMENNFPVIERTNNGLLFPEAPKNSLDMDQLEIHS